MFITFIPSSIPSTTTSTKAQTLQFEKKCYISEISIFYPNLIMENFHHFFFKSSYLLFFPFNSTRSIPFYSPNQTQHKAPHSCYWFSSLCFQILNLLEFTYSCVYIISSKTPYKMHNTIDIEYMQCNATRHRLQGTLPNRQLS